MLLALCLFLVLLIVGQFRIEIDLGKFANQIRQDKRVWIVRIEKDAALFGEIRFVRFFVDGKEELFLELEQLLLAGVRKMKARLYRWRGACPGLPSYAAAACCAVDPALL